MATKDNLTHSRREDLERHGMRDDAVTFISGARATALALHGASDARAVGEHDGRREAVGGVGLLRHGGGELNDRVGGDTVGVEHVHGRGGGHGRVGHDDRHGRVVDEEADGVDDLSNGGGRDVAGEISGTR